jgi:Asp-tRNA(Asn)/Glu-tRNA(Gln) amidotransferase A subunit family amidase
VTGAVEADPVVATAAATAARIAATDREIRAFVTEPGRPRRLAADARQLSRRWPAAASHPELFGVPVGIKDVIRVDGLPTTAGSRLPPTELAGPEAAVVHRLREAGALIAGKTVTAEFAVLAPGPTRNPRDLRHTPGGSSSGSAAAVAAGLVPLAVGTQTIGSVIRPAAYCGVAGFRPTRGRTPSDGVVPFSPSLDTVGWFAVDAAALTPAAAVLCDDWDPAAPQAAAPRPPVLGIPAGRYLDRATRPALAAFGAQARSLSTAGYQVRSVPVLDDMDDIERQLVIITRYELADVHNLWFRRYGAVYQPATAAAIREGQLIDPRLYAAALTAREHLTGCLAEATADAGVDIWIAPAATGPAPSGLASTGDPVMSIPWSMAGLPALTLPGGLVAGLPVGLQCVAAAGADERLLHWAAGLETVLAGPDGGVSRA